MLRKCYSYLCVQFLKEPPIDRNFIFLIAGCLVVNDACSEPAKWPAAVNTKQRPRELGFYFEIDLEPIVSGVFVN